MRCCEGDLRKGQRGIRTPKKELLCQGSRAGEFGGGGQLQTQVRQGLKGFSSNSEVTGDYLRRRSDYKGRWQRWCVWVTLLRNLLVKGRESCWRSRDEGGVSLSPFLLFSIRET